MATPNRSSREEILTQTYPEFLELLKTDTSAGVAEFDRCVRSWLLQHPSPCLRTLAPEDREEIIGDLIYHLISDDAARLRRYEDQGSPFLAYLTTAVERRCKSFYRKKREDLLVDQVDDNGMPRINPAAPRESLDGGILAKIVWEFIQDLDVECQLVLLGFFKDGLKPREMVPLLGYTGREQANKQVSDRLRYCKKALAQRIYASGYDRSDFFE
jgi:DNA-directed RNA polymerase specialized sigma24 family protein